MLNLNERFRKVVLFPRYKSRSKGQYNSLKSSIICQIINNCKPVSTPADVNSHLEPSTDDCELVDKNKYQSAVGSLLYFCLLYTSPSPRDKRQSRMPSSA